MIDPLLPEFHLGYRIDITKHKTVPVGVCVVWVFGLRRVGLRSMSVGWFVALSNRFPSVLLVFDFADQFLQHVFQRHHPDGLAVLVHGR